MRKIIETSSTWLSCLLFALVLLSASFNISAEPKNCDEISSCALSKSGIRSYDFVQIEYFEVRGASSAELRESLDKHGPRDQFGRPRDAYTRWDINWSWPRSPSGKPIFEQTTSELAVSVVFPRWKIPEQASPQLISDWRRFVNALAAHELEHIKPAIEHAAEIESTIKKNAAINPDWSFKDANDAARGILARLRKADQDYDRTTRNGATQGVKFP